MVVTDSMVEGIDYVKCPICGRCSKYLSQRHLLPVHGLTRESFLEKYPGFVMCSESYRKSVSRSFKERWKDSEYKRDVAGKISDSLKKSDTLKKISEKSKEMWNRDGFREENSKKIREGFSKSGFSKEQSKRMKEFWSNKKNKEERSSLIKEGIKKSETFSVVHSKNLVDIWKDPEKREKRSKSIREAFDRPDVYEERSKKSKDYWSKNESRKKQSEASKRNWKDSEYVRKVTDGYKQFYYKTLDGKVLYLRSSYEEIVCKYLEKNSIKFDYQMSSFPYKFEGESHEYWPDFFLTDLDLILEVKPERFINEPLVQAKFNAVKGLGKNIVFVSEKQVFSEDEFLNLIRTSTTILKQP